MRWLLDWLGFLRTLLFTIPLIYLYTVVLGLVWVLVLPFDPTGRRLHSLARLWSRLILATTLVRVHRRGLENLAPGQHYVYVANHQSYMDIPILFAYVPAAFRIMAKASLFSIPIVGWHLRRTGHLPISFTNARADARRLLEAVRYLREGHSLVVFPEGGRSVSGGLEEFKTGIFLAALKVGAPIIPVTLRGTRQLLARDSWTVRPGQVELIFDPPVVTAGLGKTHLEELAARVRQRIEENFWGGTP